MWSRNSNNCQFKDMCPLGDQSCSYSRSGNFSECGNYQMWSGEDNPCPYKNKCSDYPHLCLYAGNLDACYKYGRFSGDEISRMVDENWKSDNQEDEKDLFDVENIDEDENFEEDEEVYYLSIPLTPHSHPMIQKDWVENKKRRNFAGRNTNSKGNS